METKKQRKSKRESYEQQKQKERPEKGTRGILRSKVTAEEEREETERGTVRTRKFSHFLKHYFIFLPTFLYRPLKY